jgi:hypothetical protein
MRIAWSKFGAAMTYGSDALVGPSGGTNLKSRYIRQLLAMGHDVFPIVPMTRKSEPWPGSPEADITTADLVIVEEGPNSLLSHYRGTTAIQYLNEQLARYEGPVIYIQSDPDLPFAFFPEAFTPKYYTGPTHADLMRNKKWRVVTCCRNIPEFKAANNGRRYQYENLPDVEFKVVELHNVLADPESIQPRNYDGMRSSTYNVGAYIGGDRRFCRKMVEYGEHYAMDIYGKWSEEKLARIEYTQFRYKGVLPDGQVLKTYAEYFHSLAMGSPKYERVGLVSARLWEAAFAGNYPLLDSDLPDPTNGHIIRVTPQTIREVIGTQSRAWWWDKAEELQGLLLIEADKHPTVPGMLENFV